MPPVAPPRLPAASGTEYELDDAKTVRLSAAADVLANDVDLLREAWGVEGDDELVRRAVRECAAILGRRREFFETGHGGGCVGGKADVTDGAVSGS